MLVRSLCLCVLVSALNGPAAAGAPPAPAALPEDVRAVYQKRCVECHGAGGRKGGLDLSTAAGVARGGRKGPVVVPGKPADSRLWQMIHKDRMPPDEPLPEVERRAVRRWIEA